MTPITRFSSRSPSYIVLVTDPTNGNYRAVFKGNIYREGNRSSEPRLTTSTIAANTVQKNQPTRGAGKMKNKAATVIEKSGAQGAI